MGDHRHRHRRRWSRATTMTADATWRQGTFKRRHPRGAVTTAGTGAGPKEPDLGPEGPIVHGAYKIGLPDVCLIGLAN